MPKAGLPGTMAPGDRIATVYTGLPGLGAHIRDAMPPTPSLPELLCEIKKRCGAPENIDLDLLFREAGGGPSASRGTYGTSTRGLC